MNYMDQLMPGYWHAGELWPSYACFRKFTVDGKVVSVVWKAEYAGEANLAGQIPVTGEVGMRNRLRELLFWYPVL